MSEHLITSEERIRELVADEGIHVSVHRILLTDVIDRLERSEEALRRIADGDYNHASTARRIAQKYFKQA